VKKSAFALCAAALALGLAGCGGGTDNNLSAAASNTPLPQIAAPNGGDWTEIATMTDRGGFLLGNPNAPVKLIEYASITCPHCAEFAEAGGAALRDRYVRSGQVSWEYRPYLLFPSDPGVFLMLRCIGPAAFFRTAEQLYADQRNWVGRLQALPQDQAAQIDALPTPALKAAAYVRASGLDQFFRQRGIPEARMNQCLADPAALQQYGEMTRRGDSEDGVTGTPTFLINGEHQDAGRWSELEPLLRRAIGS
jgi:protein-disulfide isomerase